MASSAWRCSAALSAGSARSRFFGLALLSLGGCATGPAPACPTVASADVVYVVDHGWHTDIGVPAAELSGPVARFRAVFPGARSLLFSFGKRTFMTAKVDRWEEWVLGPFPGPGAILVTGLAVLPDQAFVDADAVELPVPAGGMAELSAFLWRQFEPDRTGAPRLIARGPSPGSLFYAASARYGFGHTCNAWTADALRQAGLAVRPDGVVFSGQVMGRARRAAQCVRPLP